MDGRCLMYILWKEPQILRPFISNLFQGNLVSREERKGNTGQSYKTKWTFEVTWTAISDAEGLTDIWAVQWRRIAIPFHVVQIWRRCINMNHSLSIVPGFAYSMSPAPTMIERTITLADEDAHSEQQQPFYRAYGQVVGGGFEYMDFGIWRNKTIVI